MSLINYGIRNIVRCRVLSIYIICCTRWIYGISIQGDKNFQEPDIHEANLNNLDMESFKKLSREQLLCYFNLIEDKIKEYVSDLTDEQLLEYPVACEYCKFTLILAQFRHLHTHMGMIMGFVIDDTGLWPRVLGLESPFPQGKYDKYL